MRPVVICVLVGLVLASCKKKPDSPPSEAPTGSVTYAIKLPKRNAPGTKCTVTRTCTTSTTLRIAGEKQVTERTSEEKYVLTVIEPGETMVRAYQYARDTDGPRGAVNRSYSGKTVTIARKNDLYTFTADGHLLADPGELAKEFEADTPWDLEELLPGYAVRIDEQWEVSKDVLRKIARRSPVPLDSERTTCSGRLMKAYRNEGKFWGAVQWQTELAFGAPVRGPQRCKETVSFEAPIDGSTGDVKMTSRITGAWMEEGARGEQVNCDYERVESITSVPINPGASAPPRIAPHPETLP